MKKFMFSAVAVVAFSFAGMANNEVKEVDFKNGLYDCIDYANDQVDAAQEAVDFPLSQESEDTIWLDAMNNCD